MTPQPSTFLAFGKVTDPHAALRNEGADISAWGAPLGRQVAFLGDGTSAFRLNTPGWMKVAPELVGALDERDQLRLLCRDRLQATIPAFAAATRRWIDRYLDLAEEMATAATAAGDTLNEPSDVFFDVLLPLPATHFAALFLGATNALPLVDGGEFVRLDLALWDGARLTCVLFGDTNSATPREQASLDRICAAARPPVSLHRITTQAQGDALADALLRPVMTRPGPWFGPYRAPEFQRPLP